jgi:hypothetical protein
MCDVRYPLHRWTEHACSLNEDAGSDLCSSSDYLPGSDDVWKLCVLMGDYSTKCAYVAVICYVEPTSLPERSSLVRMHHPLSSKSAIFSIKL